MKNVSMFLLFAFLAALANNVGAQFAFNEASQKQMAITNLPSMPLVFTENQGQWGEKTLFKAEAGGATFYFCGNEVAYLFVRDSDELLEDELTLGRDITGIEDKFSKHRFKQEALLIKAQFVDANPNPEVIGEGRLSHNCNYFYGNDPAKWRTDVPNYSSITYKNIWPGIDLKYHGNGKGMKYDFIVNPGADISRIRIRYEGIDKLDLTASGSLRATTGFGPAHEKTPFIYQEFGGIKHEVSGRYELIEPDEFGFAIDDYDPGYPLVIDPELVYSTYLGGSGLDESEEIAVDGSGCAYITGRTFSSDFPTVNPYDGSLSGHYNVFITKLSSEGNMLDYSTYLGGSAIDQGWGIAVDSTGSAYVVGKTCSSDFPTVNPYDGSIDDYMMEDVFITKLSPMGNSLIYSTYLGGNSCDGGLGVAVNNSENAYVTGYTLSTDFPTVNPFDDIYNGPRDVFVAKISTDGSSLIYSTYLGGSDFDQGYGIAVDDSGNAYITGRTYSTDFPTANPFIGSICGSNDIFVTKLSSAGNLLTYSTYLGGSSSDYTCGYGGGIAIDGSGYAYVAGYTESEDFPMFNPYDGIWSGGTDVFISKFSQTGDSLVYSTYLGGIGSDWAYGIAVDYSGSAYVTGYTNSADFPTLYAYDESLDGSSDVFVTKLSPAGDSLTYSTFLGRGDRDFSQGIAIDGSGMLYITGKTHSSDFPLANPYDSVLNHIFVTKLYPKFTHYYLPGDVNMSGGAWPPAATGPDVTYLVNFFRGAPTNEPVVLT